MPDYSDEDDVKEDRENVEKRKKRKGVVEDQIKSMIMPSPSPSPSDDDLTINERIGSPFGKRKR
jgi:hypothetical protein